MALSSRSKKPQRKTAASKLAPTEVVIPFCVGCLDLTFEAMAKWYLNGWRD